MIKASLLPLIGLLCACTAALPNGTAESARGTCSEYGYWVVPGARDRAELRTLLNDWATRSIILLGESHTSVQDHTWQLQVLAALHGRTPRMVLGFEAFPRRVQPVLDSWIAGELSFSRFLDEVGWQEIWGFAPTLYQPLFEFARMNRLPMVALNVERSLVRRVGREGWTAVPQAEREGLSDPAPAIDDYVAALADVRARHQPAAEDRTDGEPSSSLQDPGVQRFVEAQLTWDRAMAEALSAARSRHPGHLVVGIAGRGHVEYGYGIPHQLAALGVDDAVALLTWPAGSDCGALMSATDRPIADAVFIVAPDDADMDSEAVKRPQLGVLLSKGEGGVRIDQVVEGSVAEAAGLLVGDVVTEAAGRPVARVEDLARMVGRQPFGTWLPLVILREGARRDLIAKFPARPHPPMAGPSPHRRGG